MQKLIERKILPLPSCRVGGIIMPGRQKLDPVRDRKLIQRIVRQVCHEFGVTPQEIFQKSRGKENLLNLMIIFLAGELGGFAPSVELNARRRFKKYLKFIPDLSDKCEELKEKIIKKADGS